MQKYQSALFRSFVLLTSILLGACGGHKIRIQTGPACAMGEKSLKNKLGPELDKILKKQPLARAGEAPYGCALIYTAIPEETVEDLDDLEESAARQNQYLATLFFDKRGNIRFKKVSSAEADANGLVLDISLKSVTHDDWPDLIIEESGPETGEGIRYRGIRILNGAPGSGQQLFSRRLLMVTAEGLKIIPRWRLEVKPRSRKILIDGAGKTETYLWNRTQNRFISLNPVVKPVRPDPEPTPKNTAQPQPLELPES